jgi:predicted DNA-binding transcriptional regulator AlpA
MAWRVWIESEPISAEDWSKRVDALLDRLEREERVLGPVGWGSAGRTLGAVFEVRNADPISAASTGYRAFIRALEAVTGDIGAVRLMRMEIAEADYEPDELLGATDVARLLGVSRQRVYQLRAATPGFPQPATHLSRGALWSRADVEAWSRRRAEATA